MRVPEMNSCIFCKIVEGKASAEKIYETESIVSFLDVRPKALGHSLVIPKKHVEVLTDLEDELIVSLARAVKEVEHLLKKSLHPDAFTIGINDGSEAGQEIPHLHVNIIPRYSGDRGTPIQHVVNNPPTENISDTAKKIR
jgi:histidine triad (HIT) family protein